MHWIVGLIILAFLANALGAWFWILGAVIGGVIAYGAFMEEQSITDEERAARRRQKEERRHAMDMLRIEEHRARQQLELQAEYQKKQQKSPLVNGVGGAAAKFGVALLVRALTGTNHRHRH